MELVEGNQQAIAIEDSIHGTHAMTTYFRNQFTGRDTANSPTQQTVPILLQSFSRYANIVGNVLGTVSYHNTYQTNTGAGSTANCDKSIYNLGWGNVECASGSGAGQVIADPATVSSAMLWGNYDTVNGAVRWVMGEDGSGDATYPGLASPSMTLPASFYLAAKPAWWGTMPYPAIEPDVSGGSGPAGHAYLIPAANCYVNVMGGPTTSVGSALSFNASTCYTAAASPPNPPTNLIVTIVN